MNWSSGRYIVEPLSTSDFFFIFKPKESGVALCSTYFNVHIKRICCINLLILNLRAGKELRANYRNLFSISWLRMVLTVLYTNLLRRIPVI
jgi:hypothetical protein